MDIIHSFQFLNDRWKLVDIYDHYLNEGGEHYDILFYRYEMILSFTGKRIAETGIIVDSVAHKEYVKVFENDNHHQDLTKWADSIITEIKFGKTFLSEERLDAHYVK